MQFFNFLFSQGRTPRGSDEPGWANHAQGAIIHTCRTIPARARDTLSLYELHKTNSFFSKRAHVEPGN